MHASAHRNPIVELSVGVAHTTTPIKPATIPPATKLDCRFSSSLSTNRPKRLSRSMSVNSGLASQVSITKPRNANRIWLDERPHSRLIACNAREDLLNHEQAENHHPLHTRTEP